MKNEKTTKIAIVSMTAGEYLPPLISWISDRRWNDYRVKVFSTHWLNGRYPLYNGTVPFYRTPTHFPAGKLVNLWDQLVFSICTFFRLLFFRPSVILDIERGSSVPVYFYMLLFHRSTKLFIHYYEYSGKSDLAKCGFTNHLAHLLECQLLKWTVWVSQCNAMRMNAYREEYNLPPVLCHEIHNYPPARWLDNFQDHHSFSFPVRTVFCGVRMDLETLYVKEFAEFVLRQNGRLLWDIYLASPGEEIKKYIADLASPWIRLFVSDIDYNEMPQRLKQYDIGVVLYKGITLNRKYVECNKFYEYLSCGLDVWSSSKIETQKSLATSNSYPKILLLDFEHLNKYNLDAILSHEKLELKRPCDFTSEKALDQFFNSLYSELAKK